MYALQKMSIVNFVMFKFFRKKTIEGLVVGSKLKNKRLLFPLYFSTLIKDRSYAECECEMLTSLY